MYLSDRDLEQAIQCGKLIITPAPKKIDATSIDLHLDSVAQARIWDISRFKADKSDEGEEGLEPRAGQIRYKNFAKKYQVPVPEDAQQPVFRRHNQIIVKPGGFVLWQTHEIVGTPEDNPELICFTDRCAETINFLHTQFGLLKERADQVWLLP